MNPIYLFEAGGTKTSLLIQDQGEIQGSELPGFNPNRSDTDLYKVLEGIDIPREANLFFYGAGLGSSKLADRVSTVFKSKYGIEAKIESDLLGAARALCGREAGVVGIMGTGGVAAFYDGEKIVRRSGGWGYMIDDLGGGYELGKAILSAWLDGRFNEKIDSCIEDYLKMSKAEFVPSYYANPDISLVSNVPVAIIEYKSERFIHTLIYNYFKSFFERHILWLCKEYNCQSIALNGGVAYHYADIIASVSNDLNIIISNILDKPSQELLKYHLKDLTV